MLVPKIHPAPQTPVVAAAILNSVADLKFSQPARQNFLLPILGALAVLAAAFALYMHLAPVATIDITVPHTNIFGAHTIFKPEGGGDMTVIRPDKAEDDLYILATLHLDNHTKLPIFLKDFTSTLITPDGQILNSSATEKDEFANLYTAFADLKKMATTPLLRETEIPPGQSAEGMVLFHFPTSKDAWHDRKSASVTVDFYHQASQTVSLDAKH
jgi:hypothetical protein